MTVALTLVLVAGTAVLVAGAAERRGWNGPVLLLLVGVVGSYLPFIPQVRLTSDVVLYGLLPPLLYAAAIRTSLVDFTRHRAAILSLSVGLVLFTALGVAAVAYALLPISYGLAFALGAIVAPPDAVAATTVARKVGMPRRIVTILEGESLLNDATALVALRTGLALAGLGAERGPIAATTDGVSTWTVALSFVWAVVGGLSVGVAVALAASVLRRRRLGPELDTALSFTLPFLAFLPAEALGASGVLAVVTAGLILGHRALTLQNARSRLSEGSNWASVQFIGESAVFLMIGLQMRDIVTTTQNDSMSLSRVLLAAGVILVVVMLLRPLWVFPSRWLLSRRSHGSGLPPRELALVSWAGMRGVVTLAAAFLVPASSPERQAIIFIAMVVAIGTLTLQGLTLPWLTRALKVQGPDAREDALQQAVLTEHAVSAGLAELDQHRDESHALLRQLRQEAQRRTHQGWERVGPRGVGNDETPSDAYRRLRLGMISAEREELVRLRNEGAAEHELLAEILQQLDIEESVLESFAADRQDGERRTGIRPPRGLEGGCSHLAQAPEDTKAVAPECVGCREAGSTWVHLRKCLSCGYVGCCDSSPQVHATKHYERTHHPVVESFEEGEAWRWCYVDGLTG
ncbi:MAG TPA: cation:proton antiporter [Ornithinimicrobium sp.]|uniref:cation:proton antiporter domain-containing protein n=1 Tax=Ornithinimicrobium sp. TaxID=1977084 RepID=UPI002B467886|nr:cation:proton antiporter [Ornithinimicrobium sp.]HKJ12629.1 cation:proton antiporter [Ornithinimicrobium sp.]